MRKILGVVLLVVVFCTGASVQKLFSTSSANAESTCGSCDADSQETAQSEEICGLQTDNAMLLAAAGNGCNNSRCKCRPFCRCPKDKYGKCSCR